MLEYGEHMRTSTDPLLSPTSYTHAQLAIDMGAVPTEVVVDAVTSMRAILLSYLGNPTNARHRYIVGRQDGWTPGWSNLARRDVSVPPFPGQRLPEHAFAVTTVSNGLNTSSVLHNLRRLIKATCWNTPSAPPPMAPTFWNVVLGAPNVPMHMPRAAGRWLVGQDELVAQMTLATGPFAVVFSPATADPSSSPLTWARLLNKSHEDTTIGYAYRYAVRQSQMFIADLCSLSMQRRHCRTWLRHQKVRSRSL